MSNIASGLSVFRQKVRTNGYDRCTGCELTHYGSWMASGGISANKHLKLRLKSDQTHLILFKIGVESRLGRAKVGAARTRE